MHQSEIKVFDRELKTVAQKESFEEFTDSDTLESFLESILPISVTFSTTGSSDGIPRMANPCDVIHKVTMDDSDDFVDDHDNDNE